MELIRNPYLKIKKKILMAQMIANYHIFMYLTSPWKKSRHCQILYYNYQKNVLTNSDFMFLFLVWNHIEFDTRIYILQCRLKIDIVALIKFNVLSVKHNFWTICDDLIDLSGKHAIRTLIMLHLLNEQIKLLVLSVNCVDLLFSFKSSMTGMFKY